MTPVMICSRSTKHNAFVLLLEPFDGILFLNLVLDTNLALTRFPACDSKARPLEADIEIHSVDSCRRIVLDAEIDVLGDAKAKVTSDRKVLAI